MNPLTLFHIHFPLSFKDTVKIIHFLGGTYKPWEQNNEYLYFWWHLYHTDVKPLLADDDRKIPSYKVQEVSKHS